ncbi:MAG: hypothetical protein QN204_04935 [Armatimonadota bacterium]|nr:hypothetical protein [Armatimonadota bacterium]
MTAADLVIWGRAVDAFLTELHEHQGCVATVTAPDGRDVEYRLEEFFGEWSVEVVPPDSSDPASLPECIERLRAHPLPLVFCYSYGTGDLASVHYVVFDVPQRVLRLGKRVVLGLTAPAGIPTA